MFLVTPLRRTLQRNHVESDADTHDLSSIQQDHSMAVLPVSRPISSLIEQNCCTRSMQLQQLESRPIECIRTPSHESHGWAGTHIT
jgi:hypothetical protein